MAHFVKIENNLVTEMMVINNDVVGVEFPASEHIGKEFIAKHGYEGNWIQTSYNNNFRKQYGRIGYTYNDTIDQFIAPRYYASWSLDSNNDWQPPTPKPEGDCLWDEEQLKWIELQQ